MTERMGVRVFFEAHLFSHTHRRGTEPPEGFDLQLASFLLGPIRHAPGRTPVTRAGAYAADGTRSVGKGPLDAWPDSTARRLVLEEQDATVVQRRRVSCDCVCVSAG